MPAYNNLVHLPALAVAAALVVSVALPVSAATKAIEMPGFTGVAIESALKAKIVVGGPQSIKAEAHSQANLDKLRLEVIDGKLHAWVERDVWDYVSFNDPNITITITVPELHGLEASAAAAVNASGLSGDSPQIAAASGSKVEVSDVDARYVGLTVSSAGELRLNGECVTANVLLSSGGYIGGHGFECVDVNVGASSAGRALLFASGHVNADASSGALIQLTGNPDHIDDEKNSGGNVEVLF